MGPKQRMNFIVVLNCSSVLVIYQPQIVKGFRPFGPKEILVDGQLVSPGKAYTLLITTHVLACPGKLVQVKHLIYIYTKALFA